MLFVLLRHAYGAMDIDREPALKELIEACQRTVAPLRNGDIWEEIPEEAGSAAFPG